MQILVPQGIGDALWALTKVQDVVKRARAATTDILIACTNPNEIESRAFDLLKRFDFVSGVSVCRLPLNISGGPGIHAPGPLADGNGCYRYVDSGPGTLYPEIIDFVLIPNGALERGTRLEAWLPEYEIDWDICRQLKTTPAEQHTANDLLEDGPYVVFFFGSTEGNTTAGHNKDALWRPYEWYTLGQLVKATGRRVIVVGATWDWSYYQNFGLSFNPDPKHWQCLIGKTNTGVLSEILRRASCVVAYQSGVGVLASYLGTRTAMFWRPKGNSVLPNLYVSFEESMASGWVKPETLEKGDYLPLIYTRCTPQSIFDEMKTRGWL